MKRKLPPGYTAAEADATARKLFGPFVSAQFEPWLGKADRFVIAARFKDAEGWKFGALGTGKNWVDAIADAEARWTAYQNRKKAETSGETSTL